MADLKHDEDALDHPYLKGQAFQMIDLYLQGEQIGKMFEKCGIPYTTHTRKIFAQCRRAVGIKKRPRFGPVNPRWTGKPKYRKGYRYVPVLGTVDKFHRTCYRPEHHVVMEKILGRPLLKTEVVHHLDNDILNNSPENLRLYSTNGAHLADTLVGKCPNWSEAGRLVLKRLWEARRKHPLKPDGHGHTEMNPHLQDQPASTSEHPL